MPERPKKVPTKPTEYTPPPRRTTTERGYGHSWQVIRELKLRAEPVCEVCRKALATQVHHRNHRTDDNRPENLCSICEPCHAKHHHRNGQ